MELLEFFLSTIKCCYAIFKSTWDTLTQEVRIDPCKYLYFLIIFVLSSLSSITTHKYERKTKFDQESKLNHTTTPNTLA